MAFIRKTFQQDCHDKPWLSSGGSHHAAHVAAAAGSVYVRAFLCVAADADFPATDMQCGFTPCCDVLPTRRSMQIAVSREDPAVQ